MKYPSKTAVSIVLKNKNCFDFLPELESDFFSLILIDPPYEISRNTNFQSGKATGKDTDRFRVSMNFGNWDSRFIGLDIIIAECYRVLKKGGTMLMAIPSEMHLWELKKSVYDTPYKNEVKPYELDGFNLLSKNHINYRFMLDNQQDIQSLFSMTPYYYRTGKIQQERLSLLDGLEVTADFELLTYQKK